MNMVMDMNMLIWFAAAAVVIVILLVTVAVILRIHSNSHGPVIPESVDSAIDTSKTKARGTKKSEKQIESNVAVVPNEEVKSELLPESTSSRIKRLRERLAHSANPFGRALFNIISKDHLSEEDWEDVEDTLLMADVGSRASEELVEDLRKDARIAGTSNSEDVHSALRTKLLKIVDEDADRRLNVDKSNAHHPSVIMMVGVNGTGKTTTAGKLARLFIAKKRSVMFAAADTFRAAAADQLETWASAVSVPVVRANKDGADPASVAFIAANKAKEEQTDLLIVDTAGRLQNKANLMEELGKIRRA